jgi:hypothetical protein
LWQTAANVGNKWKMSCLRAYGVATIARYWVMEMAVSETLYLIIERFKNGDPAPVYRRFREQGRMAPDGLKYISSWVEQDLTTCYQIMQTADRKRLDQWMETWKDLVDFEVHRVMTSAEAAERVASLRVPDS